MTTRFKFYYPISREKFLFQLTFAKKTHQQFKRFLHVIEMCIDGSSEFILKDDKGIVVLLIRFEFYPDGVVIAECENRCLEELESLLVFGLLEQLDEKAFVRFIDTKFFYSDGEFFVVQDGPCPIIRKLSSDKNRLLEVENYRIPKEILAENGQLDFL